MCVCVCGCVCGPSPCADGAPIGLIAGAQLHVPFSLSLCLSLSLSLSLYVTCDTPGSDGAPIGLIAGTQLHVPRAPDRLRPRVHAGRAAPALRRRPRLVHHAVARALGPRVRTLDPRLRCELFIQSGFHVDASRASVVVIVVTRFFPAF